MIDDAGEDYPRITGLSCRCHFYMASRLRSTVVTSGSRADEESPAGLHSRGLVREAKEYNCDASHCLVILILH